MSEAKGQEWMRDGATVYRLNEAGTNDVTARFYDHPVKSRRDAGRCAELAQHSMNAMESAAARLNVDPAELAKALAEGEGIAGMVEACQIAMPSLKSYMELTGYGRSYESARKAAEAIEAALAAIPKPTDAA